LHIHAYAFVFQFIYQLRPDSHSVVTHIVSATFWITRLADHPILGCPSLMPLPEQLVASRTLFTFVRNTHNQMYDDNYCALRCVALHQTRQLNPTATERTAGFEACVKQLLHDFCLKSQVRAEQFKGVPLNQMDLLEDIAKADINIFKFTMPGEVEGDQQPDNRAADMNVVEGRLFDAMAAEGREDTPPPDDMDRLLDEYARRPEGLAGRTFVEANNHYVRDEGGNFPADNLDYENDDLVVEEEDNMEQPYFEIVSYRYHTTSPNRHID